MATISSTPRPGYAWDATDNCWYPIGTGPHTHSDYITQSTAINPAIVDAKGDIIAATAADSVARLAVGANNTVLTADSSTATGLKWAAPAGGGKVLQVVSATYATPTTIATQTMTDTGLSLSITPTSASSKILIMVAQEVNHSRSSSESGVGLRLMRDATVTYDISSAGFRASYIGSSSISQGGLQGVINFNYLDNPATTSAITYKTQARVYETTNSGTSSWNNVTSVITLMEIGA